MAVIKKTAASRAAQVDKLILEAAKTGNIESAITKHGKSLSVAEANVLRSLTSQDLREITRLRDKLGPLGKAVADNNGGIF